MLLFSIMFFCYSNVDIIIMCYSYVIILHRVRLLLKCRYHHNVLFVCYYSPSCFSVTQMSIASCVIRMLLFSIMFFCYSNVDSNIMCYSYVIILHHVRQLLKCRYHHNVLFVCYYSPSCSSVTQMSISS